MLDEMFQRNFIFLLLLKFQIFKSNEIKKKLIMILTSCISIYFCSFDPFQKKRGGPKSEESKLKHKIKREQKGAKKDLRADTAFLAKQKAKERRDKDSERMQKTKAIMSGLGSQEGEFREFQRQKGGKKSKSKY